ncbi:cytochrome c oxidase subunit 3 [Aestuariivivens sp. NBU2969]|uniref:cytochrome c oxidase subunit 3 n=1 Tax=Aestuariivivens sp. NBU2969 TaxID=2873267 RepID=UPI001CC051D9|nr:cytochrome c oxidase subunit 3 [Aestuariivivens sp. NBU2969]
MDLTQGTQEEKNSRAKKMMLWFGIISLVMTFAGWTSAYIVSKSRPDWLHDFELPNAFMVSLFIIIVSSVTFILAKRALKKDNRSQTMFLLMLTLALGLGFVYNQFQGFGEIIGRGFHFTGPTSNITMTFIFVIAFMHILHVVVGLICLLVVIYNHFKQKYTPANLLGFELAATFWHFLDVLWVLLFLFLYFFR